MTSRKWLILKLAFRNIRLNWRHSMATSLAIMGGFTAISLFDGFMSALRDYNEERYVRKAMVGHVVIEKAGSKENLFSDPWRYSLDKEEQALVSNWLDKHPMVEDSMRYLILTGLISSGAGNAIFIATGVEEDHGKTFRGEKWAFNVVAGKPLYMSSADSLLIGAGLARRMDCRFNEPWKLNSDGSYLAEAQPLTCSNFSFQLSGTTEAGQANAISLDLAGVADFQLREFNDKVIVLPLAAAQRLMDTESITRIHVLLREPSQIGAFAADINARARASGLELEAVPWMDHPVAAAAKGGLEIMGVFRGLFLSIVAVIAAMSVANSMMKSINERIREIGMLRSFGFHCRDIHRLFSFEGLLLAAFSCMGGIVLSTVLAAIIDRSGLTFKAGVLSTPMPVHIATALSTWIVTAVVLSSIAFLASWLVSRKTARMVIADALRYVA